MKKKRIPGRSDLEAIRDQILDFACSKHDFRLEAEDFPPDGDWKGEFIVKFRDDNAKEEKLFCEAPLGEHFFRFGLDLIFDEEIWEKEHENIIQKVSGYDVAIYMKPAKGGGDKRHCRLYSRAWIPNFNQRIFGLTLSNLMDCKDAVLTMFSKKN